jgi:hypothetical protein
MQHGVALLKMLSSGSKGGVVVKNALRQVESVGYLT